MYKDREKGRKVGYTESGVYKDREKGNKGREVILSRVYKEKSLMLLICCHSDPELSLHCEETFFPYSFII